MTLRIVDTLYPVNATPDNPSWRLAVLTGLLFGLVGMGASATAVTVPDVTAHFGIRVELGAWLISGYTLSLAVTTAMYGRVADRVGVRAPFTLGVVLMSFGAAVSACTVSYELLIVARVVQGAGAACVPVLALSAIRVNHSGAQRSRVTTRMTGVALVFGSTGPVLGGVLEAAIGWRAALALPVLGVGLLIPLWRCLPNSGGGGALDALGALWVALTATGLVLVVQATSTGAVVAWVGLGCLVVGLPSAVARLRRRPHGFVPHAVLSDRSLLVEVLAASTVPASWYGMLVVIPVALSLRGWDAFEIGLALLPGLFAGLLGPALARQLFHRVSPRALLQTAAGIAVSSLLLVAAGTSHSPVAVLVGVFLISMAFSIGQPSLAAVVNASVPAQIGGVALGLATLVFMLGGGVGSAVGSVVTTLGPGPTLIVLAVLPLTALVALARPRQPR